MKAERLVILDWDTMAYDAEELSPKRFSELACRMEVFGLTKPEETAAHIGDADAVICNKVLLTHEVLEQCPNIRYIGILATGYNNVDLQAASERGIPVCNAGSYSTNAVAQLVFSYILDHYEQTARYIRAVRAGEWETAPTFSYFPYITEELAGKRLCIIGYGSIGKQVAKIANAFGMAVSIATRTPPLDCPYPLITVEEAFAQADILTLHCPLNEQTKHLVNEIRLAKMKPNAVLINTSRGGTVDEQALADALNTGKIAAAYLDVIDREPMTADTPLKTAQNCFITPHIGWTPHDTRARLLDITYSNLKAWLGGKPQNAVN